MNANKKKVAPQKQATNHSAKKTDQPIKETPFADWHFAILLTLLYLILALWGSFHHEPWRDEFQALLIAQNSHSLSELFFNIRQEGHPAMWHLMLYGISLFTKNIAGMKILHVCMASMSIFLITAFSPFQRPIKILLSFGYFIFYEYMMINRPYGAGMLFLFAFCVLYGMYVSKRNTYLLLCIGLDIFLLANTSIFGVMLSMALLFFLFVDARIGHLKNYLQKENKAVIFSSIIFAITGLVIAILQIRPPADNHFPIQYATGYDLSRLKYALTKIGITYLPISKMGAVNCWNTSIFLKDQKDYFVFISVMLITLFSFLFRKRTSIFLLYLGGTIGLLAFNYYTFQFGNRYSGHFFLLLMACFWLFKTKEKPTEVNAQTKQKAHLGKIGMLTLYLLLVIQFFSGVYIYTMDIIYPFSNIDALGKYIQENKLENTKIVGTTDYLASPVSYFTRLPIYLPESKSMGTFITWDTKRLDGKLEIPEVFNQMKSMVEKQSAPVLLILSPELKVLKDGSPAPFEEGDIAEGIKMRSIAKIDKDCMEETEKYYLYIVEKK